MRRIDLESGNFLTWSTENPPEGQVILWGEYTGDGNETGLHGCFSLPKQYSNLPWEKAIVEDYNNKSRKWRFDKRTGIYGLDDHPEFPQEYRENVVDDELRLFRKWELYTAEEALNNFPLLHLSHNGFVESGLSFDEMASFLGIHPNPSEIQAVYAESRGGMFRRHNTNFSRYSYMVDITLDRDNAYQKFLADLLGIKLGTFKSHIIEPNYGTRLDREGHLGKFLERAVDEGIPVFVHTADIEEGIKTLIINGIEI